MTQCKTCKKLNESRDESPTCDVWLLCDECGKPKEDEFSAHSQQVGRMVGDECQRRQDDIIESVLNKRDYLRKEILRLQIEYNSLLLNEIRIKKEKDDQT